MVSSPFKSIIYKRKFLAQKKYLPESDDWRVFIFKGVMSFLWENISTSLAALSVDRCPVYKKPLKTKDPIGAWKCKFLSI